MILLLQGWISIRVGHGSYFRGQPIDYWQDFVAGGVLIFATIGALRFRKAQRRRSEKDRLD